MSSSTVAARNQGPELERRIRELGDWFHNLNLAGIQTAPHHYLGDYPTVKWKKFAHAIPTDLSGKTVLDIGCNAGFYSFEMKRRGAKRVVAIDDAQNYLAQGQLAAGVLGLDIEFAQLSVYDLGRLQEKFDLVLFLGVFYHLRYPLLALDIIHEHVAKDLLVFQSLQRGSPEILPLQPDYNFWEREVFEQPGFPLMYFIETRYAGDVTNWWIPNSACSMALLRSAGFTIIEHPEDEILICRFSDSPGHSLPVCQKPEQT
jgi:tRNA (mo5U34)-methyltransferase